MVLGAEKVEQLEVNHHESTDSAMDCRISTPVRSEAANDKAAHKGAKVHPVNVTIESDTPTHHNTKPRPSPASWKKSNKVAPIVTPTTPPDGETKIEIPPENVITCDVVVHREKTPSISSARGMDNPAFLDDNEGTSHKNGDRETPL